MTHRLSRLALILVPMLTLCALAGSTASAANFTAGEYPATPIAGGMGAEIEWPGPRLVKCPGSADTGAALLEPSENLELKPTYGTCTGFSPLALATIEPNGCWFDFTVAEGSSDNWTGDADLECPEGVQGLELIFYSSTSTHTSKTPICIYRIEPQKLEGVTYENATPTSVSLAISSSMKMKRIAGSILICGGESQEPAFRSSTSVQALNKAGNMISMDVG